MNDDRQRAVAQLFDTMAPEYDVLEPWYEHLYARLHTILTDELARPAGADGARALDAGCGHGFQTERLVHLGYRAHGADLSRRLLALARRRVPGAAFSRADLAALPYPSAVFDAVVCCGSTLSFVEEPRAALAELARVLRPRGRLLLECEHAFSLDLGWAALSGLLGDPLGYGVSVRTLWRSLRDASRTVRLPYPGYGLLTLFRTRELERQIDAAGLRWRRAWSVHSITNLIPSTLLHRAALPGPLSALYRMLCAADVAIASWPPARGLANSLVVLAEKP